MDPERRVVLYLDEDVTTKFVGCPSLPNKTRVSGNQYLSANLT